MLRLGTVLAIKDGMASLVEHSTVTPFDVPMSAPGGVLPVVGDQWVCTRDQGFYAFDQCLFTVQTKYNPHTNFRQVLGAIGARGVADPSFADAVHPEAPHLAYIGEVRWFSFVPDPMYWVPASGQEVNRVEYRELAWKVDPDGTSETFTVPYEAVDGSESGEYTPSLTGMVTGGLGSAANEANYTYVGGSRVGDQGVLSINGQITFGTVGQTFPTNPTVRLPDGFAIVRSDFVTRPYGDAMLVNNNLPTDNQIFKVVPASALTFDELKFLGGAIAEPANTWRTLANPNPAQWTFSATLPPAYRIEGHRIFFRGLANNTSGGILPSGTNLVQAPFVPGDGFTGRRLDCSGLSAGVYYATIIEVTVGGVLRLNGALDTGDSIRLDSVSFDIDAPTSISTTYPFTWAAGDSILWNVYGLPVRRDVAAATAPVLPYVCAR